MEVVHHKADGGIILTASHNPKQWNALKLLNHKGEFINAAEGEELLALGEKQDFNFVEVDHIGSVTKDYDGIKRHVEAIEDLPLVDADLVAKAGLKVAFDAVNSTGGLAIPEVLNMLGVDEVLPLYDEPNGIFPHNPEPLPEHLTDLSELVVKKKADIGFVVDPDVDRLAIVDENGEMFGEEYTLVAVADYILQNTPGNTVSNLSSTRALLDVTKIYGGEYSASAVGEVNVVEMMKATNSIIGGEGNGGIIYPELHYGRDALVGIALILTYMAKTGKSISEIRKLYPDYKISKNKLPLDPTTDVDALLVKIQDVFKDEEINTVDGVKIMFEAGWVHLRKSNTEPIVRIYSESGSIEEANALAGLVMDELKKIM
jgi:phosphomannomutase